MQDHQCPRCGGFIPNNETPGAYPGALSRTDNKTEVCSQCGTIEAVEAISTGAAMPQSEWYVGGSPKAWVDWGWACKQCGDLEMLEPDEGVVNGPFVDGLCKHCIEDGHA